MAPEINAGYLSFLRGNAEDRLNGAFETDEAPATEAFRHQLIMLINMYGGVPEHLGRESADFVERLPYQGKFELEDAFIGIEILKHTEMALVKMIEEDEELRRNIRDSGTDDETDRKIRQGADEWDEDFNVDEKNLGRVRDSAKGFKWGIDDAGVRNSFYGADAGDIEGKIKAEAKEAKPQKKIEVTLLEGEAKPTSTPPTAEAPAAADTSAKVPAEAPKTDAPAPEKLPKSVSPAAPAPTETPKKSEPSLPAEQPKVAPNPPPAPKPQAIRIEIQAPDFSEKEPRNAFRAGMDWLADHIIAVAAGTRNRNSYPRLEPLPTLQEKFPTLTTTMARITEGVARIKKHFLKLRPPSGGEMDDALHELMNPDPDEDPKGRADKMLDLFKNLGKGRHDNEGDWEKPWGEGGWQDE